MRETETGEGSNLLQKANDLQHIFEELDKLATQQASLQTRANDQAKAMLRVAQAQTKAPTDKGADEIRRLRASGQTLQASIASAQRKMDRLRKSLNTGVSQFKASTANFVDVSSDASAENDRLYRANAAMVRTIFETLQRCVALDGKQKSESESAFEVPEESYHYIPLDIQRFLQLLISADRFLSLDPDYAKAGQIYRPVRFLEVGCATGRNVLITRASQLLQLESCFGFDINSDQIAVGKSALGLEEELEVADALTFDYGGYDLVYSFRPFQNADMQRKLERQFADSMSKGAYLLQPLGYDISLCPEFTYIGADGQIWKKTA